MSVDYVRESDIEFGFDEEELIERLVSATVKMLDCPYDVSVSVSVVGLDEIHRLNNEYREIDRPTDVLSFPMNEYDEPGVFEGDTFETSMSLDPDTDELLLGDIVLCADKVRFQAEEYGHSEEREYAFLIVHSLLHLCGFDHIEDADREIMEAKQTEILESVGIVR